MSVKWITYKGKKIIFADHEGNDEKTMINDVRTYNKMIIDSGEKEILSLASFINTSATKDFMDVVKKSGIETRDVIKKSAVIGITGIKKVLLNAYNKFTKINVHAFDTLDEAKFWLVSDK